MILAPRPISPPGRFCITRRLSAHPGLCRNAASRGVLPHKASSLRNKKPCAPGISRDARPLARYHSVSCSRMPSAGQLHPRRPCLPNPAAASLITAGNRPGLPKGRPLLPIRATRHSTGCSEASSAAFPPASHRPAALWPVPAAYYSSSSHFHTCKFNTIKIPCQAFKIGRPPITGSFSPR